MTLGMAAAPLVRVFLALCLLTGICHAQDSVMIGDVPLPAEVTVSAVEGQEFAGVWVGRWNDWRSHILIVERVGTDGRADVVYAVGRGRDTAGSWFRAEARVEGDALVIREGALRLRYSLSETGRMRAVFGEEERFAILQRHSLLDVTGAERPEALFFVGQIVPLRTALEEGGAPVDLITVIFHPEGAGPFPLALIHHGSTGTGRNAWAFDRIWTNAWLADLLNAHGWAAAFVQRRGRGGSDGLYDEGFAQDRSRGYSPDTAPALAGAERALTDADAALAALRARPEIATGPVLLGGMSRGGVVAILQAGQRPDEVTAVMNFVGGWMGEGFGDPALNPRLFARIAGFGGPVLSIYGEDDPFYSIAHSRANLAAMAEVGVESRLHVVDLPGHQNGHWVLSRPPLWEGIVAGFLADLEP